MATHVGTASRISNPSGSPRLPQVLLIVGFVLIPLIVSVQLAWTQSSSDSNKSNHTVGLGKVLSSAHRGQIFGFDIDQNGTDGIIDDAVTLSNGGLKSSIETFDINSGKITKVVTTLVSNNGDVELVTYGIGGKDIGFVDEQRLSTKNGRKERNDRFFLLNTVSGEKITGQWTLPRSKNSVLGVLAENQATNTQVVSVYRDVFGSDVPWLIVTDLATNRILNSIRLKSVFTLAQDYVKAEAVTAISSYPGGPPPINVVINLKTDKIREFNGFNNGPAGAGEVNGLAVDSSTGILCTTTEENAQVEFYKLSDGSGTWTQLPNTESAGSEINSAESVTNDPLNHLFIITQPYSSTGGSSAIYVYDEKANLKETINGFNFPNSNLPPFFNVKVVINPSLRMGWVNGPSVTQLQQFFY